MSGDYILRNPSFRVSEVKDPNIILERYQLDWTINTQSLNCVDKIDINKITGPIGRILIDTKTFLLNSFGKTSKWKIETGIYVSKSETEKYVALTLFFLGCHNQKGVKESDKDEIDVDFSFRILNDKEDKILYARQCRRNRKFCLANPALGFNKFLPLSKFSNPQRIINVKFRLCLGIFDSDNMKERIFLPMNTIENFKIVDNAEGDAKANRKGSLHKPFEYEVCEPGDLDIFLDDEQEFDLLEAIEVEVTEQPLLDRYWDSVSDCDILLTISDEATFRVHSQVLSDTSPIFRSNLELCSLALAKSENYLVIPLEPITSDIETIQTFLKYFYDPKSLCSESLKISQHKPFFLLASFYEVESLKKHSVFGYLYEPTDVGTDVGTDKDLNLQFQHGEKLFEIMKYFAMNPHEISNMSDEYFRLMRESIWRNTFILREIPPFQMFTQQVIHGEAFATNTALDGEKIKFQIILERLLFSIQ